ncbi:MAG: hypothetical protein DMG92_09720 [Acidobacteria bacterium]|nr:MAG: hypothetical protein DMG92_09720 [Acidobacteriota bacterium]
MAESLARVVIFQHVAAYKDVVRDNTLINLQTIEAARENGVKKYLYTSSACIYPGYLQKEADVTPLKEEHAYMMNQTRGLAAVEGPEFDHSLILQGYEVVKPIDRPKPSVAQIERRDCV